MADLHLNQSARLPQNPRPIVSIGLGGIVHDAHYPAYKIAGFEVIGGYDRDPDRAGMMQEKFGLPLLFDSIESAVEQAPENAVFDVAVPGSAVLDVIEQLKPGSTVLIQKPLGEDLASARKIRDLCHAKHFTAAVNFQMRFAPYIIAARDMITRGLIGDLYDMEVRMQVNTPWHLWQFLFDLPRMEILYHSIHYVDLVRSFLGNPQSVYAKSIGHPLAPDMKGGTRTTIIMDYGDNPRVNIMTNHNHAYSPDSQESYVKFEGSRGAIKIRVGLNLNYPHGVPDQFSYFLMDDAEVGWQTLPIHGSWFPEAFIGTMSSLMCYANGETDTLPTSVDDAFMTMTVVEAAYQSSMGGGTPIPQ